MEIKRFPKSLKKYVRKEKARIRREISGLKEQEELINKLYQKLSIIKTKKVNGKPKV